MNSMNSHGLKRSGSVAGFPCNQATLFKVSSLRQLLCPYRANLLLNKCACFVKGQVRNGIRHGFVRQICVAGIPVWPEHHRTGRKRTARVFQMVKILLAF